MAIENLYTLPDQKPGSGANVAYQTIAVVLGITLIAIWTATEYAAYRLAFQPALGEPLYWRIYFPFDFFKWLIQFGHVQGTEKAFKGGENIIFLLHFLVIPAIWWSVRRAKKLSIKTDLHGSAHWATPEEVNATGLLDENSGDAVYVGGWLDPIKKTIRYLTHSGAEHILAFAPTRSGKGIGLVIPTLLSWRHSILAHDIKGELWALTAGWRKAIGQVCLKFEPTANDGSSVKFNPLAEIRIGTDEEVKDVQNITTMIVDPDGKGLNDHWSKTGHSLLVGTILHVLYAENDKTLRGVASFLSDPSRPLEKSMETMMNTTHLGDRPHPVVAEAARDMFNKSENERSGVLSTAMSFLSLYRDPIVAKNTEYSEFKIKDLMNHDKPVSLYLVVPPSDKDRLKPLIRLIINQIIRQLAEKIEFEQGQQKKTYKHRLLLMLDEFAALGKLDILQESLAYIAGYGMKAYLIVQDLSQLYAAYTKDETIISNCHVRAAYAPNKIETAELLSKMSGTMTVHRQQRSYSGNRLNPMLMHVMAAEQESQRPLLTPDEAMRLPGLVKNDKGKALEGGDMLIFSAGHSPIYGKQILYFTDRVFTKRSQVPAPHETDRIITVIDQQTGEINPASMPPATNIEAPDPLEVAAMTVAATAAVVAPVVAEASAATEAETPTLPPESPYTAEEIAAIEAEMAEDETIVEVVTVADNAEREAPVVAKAAGKAPAETVTDGESDEPSPFD